MSRNGREVDIEIAESLFGLKVCKCWMCLNSGPNGECERCGLIRGPFYETSIAAAFQVVEKMMTLLDKHNDYFDCLIDIQHDGTTVIFGELGDEAHAKKNAVKSKSAPEAICRAALSALASKKESAR